jgi:hypothetical protein
MPDFQKDTSLYHEEHGYIQFTKDFTQVKYGTDEQIKHQEKIKHLQEIRDKKEQELHKQ